MDAKKKFMVGAVIVVAIFYVFWGLYDNRAGVEPARDQLDQIIRNQQQATERIGDAEESARSITAGIDEGQRAIGSADAATGRIEAGVGEAGELIASCQQILRGVRARGETKTE